MSHSFRFFFTLCAAAGVASVSAQETKRPEMTARELFYNSGAPDPAAKKDTSKIVAKRKPAAPAPATQQASSTQPPSGASPATPPSTPDGSGKIVAVSDGTRTTAPPPASGTALGLKYTILKLSGDAMTPVAPSSVFHAGDKIQFSIETNSPGYLYIVNQGSSGTWMPMFPTAEIEGGNNHVEGFHTYTFPSGYRYVFDQQAGGEKVFIIFSRDPKPDFEQLVYTLQGGQTKSAPVSQPTPKDDRQAHVLRASIDDSAVGRLHQAYARDLVIERVGDDAHADTQEKAVYVVNPTGSPDSALVADLHLVHQ
ncbi:MAG: DUF4384 domain-containing protein [Bryobacteraceae bacterium]|jgi:hypothetical protein